MQRCAAQRAQQHAGDPRPGDEQSRAQLDPERQADRPQGLRRGGPGVAVRPQPGALGEVDPEHEPQEGPDHGHHEEPDDGKGHARSVVRRGTPAARRRRPGTRYWATNPARTSGPWRRPGRPSRWGSGRPTAQTPTPSQTSTRPGRTGTAMPTSPTRMRIPEIRVVGTPGSIRSIMFVRTCDGRGLVEALGLVDDLRRHVLELGKVLAPVVCTEEELAPRVQAGAHVGLGATAVAAVRHGQGRCQSSCHVRHPFRRSGASLASRRSGVLCLD